MWERTGAPWLIADVQGGAPTLDEDGSPTVEGRRRLTTVVELALDHHAALVRDQPGRRQRRAGLPVEGAGIGMRQRGSGAGEPLTVQLDRAGGTLNQCAVNGQNRKGAGRLVREPLQDQDAVMLTSRY